MTIAKKDISEQGLIELTGYEGVYLRPYYDSVHVLTIGIGETASDIPDLHAWDLSTYITMKQAFDMFNEHIQKYVSGVNNCLIAEIEQYQFDALVSLCYNIGISGITHSTLMHRVNTYDTDEAIGQAFMMWNKPAVIIGRRTKEKNLYLNGVYSNNGIAQLGDTDGKGHIVFSKTKNIKVADYLDK